MTKRHGAGVRARLALVAAIALVATACTGGDGGEGAAPANPYGAEAKRISDAQAQYCERFGRYGTAQELVDSNVIDAPPRLHTVALIPGGRCGSSASERSDFRMICNTNEAACGEGGGVAKGGTFVVGLDSLPGEGTLNPAVNTQGGMQQAAGLLFNGLVEIDERANPVPALATRWRILDGGRTYEFDLRNGVKFHDGRPLTAADVKFSYEAALLRNHARAQTSIGPALAQPCSRPPAAPSCPSIEATEASGGGPAKIVFRFGQPYAPLLQQLTHTDGAIIPKHVFDGKPLPTAAQPWPPGQVPVGTGPFKFASQNPSEIVFERHAEYFRPPFPVIDRVVQRAIPDDNSRVQELQAGGIDWLWSVQGQQLPALRTNRDIEIDTGSQSAGGSTNCINKVIFNLWARGDAAAPLTPGTVENVRTGIASPHPVLGDVRVRRAFAHALNRDVYVSQILQNNGGRLATAPIYSAMEWAHTPTPLPRYDLAESRRLLDQAGWVPGEGGVRTKNGQRLEIDLSGFSGDQTTLMNKIRQDVAQVGIAVRPATVQPPQMTTLYRGRTFDSLIFSNCQATDPEIGVRRVYHSTAITGAPFTNGAGYQNDTVDRSFDQAARELDRQKRGQAYARAQQQLGRDLPTLWLLESVANRAFRADCEGLRPYTGHFVEFGGCKT
ncbi:MAG: ABC transporter substrate-binding protein [Actinomycetota bacterium]|nr:ABC transporter substrate-binding protein [Actinomycetota bacterium]